MDTLDKVFNDLLEDINQLDDIDFALLDEFYINLGFYLQDREQEAEELNFE